MLFQQSSDVEFAGVFYYSVVAPLAIALREDCTQCVCVYMCVSVCVCVCVCPAHMLSYESV